MTEPHTNDHINGHIKPAQLEIAIIGGGLVGLIVAAGLQSRSISVTIYEQATSRKEIGAGLGMSKWTFEALGLLDTRVQATVNKIGALLDAGMWFSNGLQGKGDDGERGKYYDFELPLKPQGIGCHRGHLMAGLDEIVEEGTIKLGKRLIRITDTSGSKVLLEFSDGTTATAGASGPVESAHESEHIYIVSTTSGSDCSLS